MAAYESVLLGRRDATKKQYAEMLDAEIVAYRAAHPAVVKAEADAKKAAEDKAAAAAAAKSAKPGGAHSHSHAHSHMSHYSASMAAALAAMSQSVGSAAYGYLLGGSSAAAAAAAAAALGGSADVAAMTGGSYDHVAGRYTPKGFKPSPALKKLEAAHNAAKTAAGAWTSAQPQTVWGRGLGAMPRSPTDAYAPEATAAAAPGGSSSAGASSASAAYVAYSGGGPDMLSIASCTEAAAKELVAALDKLTPPEDHDAE